MTQTGRSIAARALLDDDLVDGLDELLAVESDQDIATITWLGQETAAVSKITDALDRLATLRELGAERWDLDVIPANRRRLLAAYVRHATAQALRRRPPEFRYPALLSFCAEAAARTTDEITELLCAGVGAQHAKAAGKLIARKLEVADSANSSVLLLAQLLEVLLDPAIPDQQVRVEVWQRAAPEQLQLALELAAEIARPEGSCHLEHLGERYNAVRAFAPRALAALDLRAGPAGEDLLGAVEVLRDLDRRCAASLHAVSTAWIRGRAAFSFAALSAAASSRACTTSSGSFRRLTSGGNSRQALLPPPPGSMKSSRSTAAIATGNSVTTSIAPTVPTSRPSSGSELAEPA